MNKKKKKGGVEWLNAKTNPTLVDLMNKGKQEASNIIREGRRNDILQNLLSVILKPDIDDNMADWLRWLIASGIRPEEFASKMLEYDNASTCGLVWTANFIAYRCRTCGVSPCMSICGECFHRGQHEGHDFNMFRSKAGGACDCGDVSVMRSFGFCDRHGERKCGSVAAGEKSPTPPEHLMYAAKLILPRVFARFLLHLRSQQTSTPNGYSESVFNSEPLLVLFNELSSMGAAMRKLLTDVLTDKKLYALLMLTPTLSQPISKRCRFASQATSKKNLLKALESLRNEKPPDEFQHCKGLQEMLFPSTFLEELVFWNVRYEFPQKLVCFLLNMLPDVRYKSALMETFIMHYSRIAKILEQSIDSDTLSNRVVHVSVQLFSNEKLVSRMSTEYHLLEVMITSLKTMISKILIRYLVTTYFCCEHRVVNCSMSLMNKHCYWPLVSDLCNVLSHRSVAVQFMSNKTLLNTWFTFLSYFQGMNLNRRQLFEHIEFEPNTYYAAYSAELEASAYPMWALLSHLKDPSTAQLTINALQCCQKLLDKWLEQLKPFENDSEMCNYFSFHIPLHRYLSRFICQAVNVQQLPLRDVLPSTEQLENIALYPLHIQLAFYEIMTDLWIRNGLQIRGQAMTYMQCNFSSSMIDADLYLLQLCAMFTNRDWFMWTVITKFNMTNCLDFRSAKQSDELDIELKIFSNFLQFLATLTTTRVNLGLDLTELTQLELVTLLSSGDKTHSQLLEQIPERSNNNEPVKEFDSTLDQIALYNAPNLEASGNLKQGLYEPKPCIWEQYFDPIHTMLRMAYKRDFQNAMDRFTDYVKLNGKFDKSSSPWPPYRIPKSCSEQYVDPRIILNSRFFHAVIWYILYRSVYKKDLQDDILSLTIYLLELALTDPSYRSPSRFAQSTTAATATIPTTTIPTTTTTTTNNNNNNNNNNNINNTTTSTAAGLHIIRSPSNLRRGEWYEDDDLSVNLRTTITIDFKEPSVTKILASNSSGARFVPIEYVEQQQQRQQSRDPALVSTTESNSENLLVATNSVNDGSPSTANVGGVASGEDNGSGDSSIAGSSSNRTGAESSNASHSECSHIINVPAVSRLACDESIITLLLKLHSLLSDRLDSFDPVANRELTDYRIGDGAAFVGKVLSRIMCLDDECHREVLLQKRTLWPNRLELEFSAVKARQENKKKTVMERQRKIMEKYANMRKKFLESTSEISHMMELDEQQSACVGSDNGGGGKFYDCVICNQSSVSSEKSLIALVVFIQPTSVLAYRRRTGTEFRLPTSDAEEKLMNDDENQKNRFIDFSNKRYKLVKDDLAFEHLVPTLNIGWHGGVHIQTCGHHLHIDCWKSYIDSLRAHQRVTVFDKDEYLCPLCRQIANNVIPIIPDEKSLLSLPQLPPPRNNDENIDPTAFAIYDLLQLLSVAPSSDIPPNLLAAVMKPMEDIAGTGGLKCNKDKNSPIFSLFFASVIRINCELEIVQMQSSATAAAGILQFDGQSTVASNRCSCLEPLLRMMSFRTNELTNWSYLNYVWYQLVGFSSDFSCIDQSYHMKYSVPLIMNDPSALLIQFTLAIGLLSSTNLNHYHCIVKLIYNLLLIQLLTQINCNQSASRRNYWRSCRLNDDEDSRFDDSSSSIGGNDGDHGEHALLKLMKLITNALDDVRLFEKPDNEAGDGDVAMAVDEPDLSAIAANVEELSLPYLRVASLLKCYIFHVPLPSLDEADVSNRKTGSTVEFLKLARYLTVLDDGNGNRCDESADNDVALPLSHWWHCYDIAPSKNLDAVRFWIYEISAKFSPSKMIRFAKKHVENFLQNVHESWANPKLITLPKEYEKIFHYYINKPCRACGFPPEDGAICLVCGTLVCMKGDCCKQDKYHETVKHTMDCGVGTGLFLVVSSSCVIVLRDRRHCVWGCIYLDSFGEEDRDLKRGKPLYLSTDRYLLLEQQWFSHRFDYITNRKWGWHRNIM